MITRAFFVFTLFFSLHSLASSTGSLFLVGRVFPQVTVSVVQASGTETSDPQGGYRISSNMPVGTYKVFYQDFSRSHHLKKNKSFRQLVVEAN